MRLISGTMYLFNDRNRISSTDESLFFSLEKREGAYFQSHYSDYKTLLSTIKFFQISSLYVLRGFRSILISLFCRRNTITTEKRLDWGSISHIEVNDMIFFLRVIVSCHFDYFVNIFLFQLHGALCVCVFVHCQGFPEPTRDLRVLSSDLNIDRITGGKAWNISLLWLAGSFVFSGTDIFSRWKKGWGGKGGSEREGVNS